MKAFTSLKWSALGLTFSLTLSFALAGGISCLKANSRRPLDSTNPKLTSWVQKYEYQAGPHPYQLDAFKWFENNKSKDGQSWVNKWPLHYAAMKGDVEGITRLVAEGHDPNTEMTDWYKSHPLGLGRLPWPARGRQDPHSPWSRPLCAR
ncbi:MAG: hypothetical protein PVG73_16765 [Desulfobacterales bacterium]